MLTIAHANRGRPTLKDDQRLRNGLVRDLKIRTLIKCTRSISFDFPERRFARTTHGTGSINWASYTSLFLTVSMLPHTKVARV